MNSIAALPVIPLWSLAGVPPAEQLPTLIARRRYAFSLASALAGERCYEIQVWSRKKIPLLLQLRALQEDWPMIGTTQTTTIMHPLPLPEDPAELFERAAAAVPEGEQADVREVLVALWAGAVPSGLPAELQTRFGDAIRNSGLRASEEAFQAACAADPVPRQRKKKAVTANAAGQP